MPPEEYEEEDTAEINVNLFSHKGSVKLSKNQESGVKVKKMKKRQGMSA